ncbi:hypothetical protein LG52_3250 [Geobacillus kaustophilus]|uniref:Uncharacterized protein n=1 Tax=Geobacillus kaustophilus TaxID=1462 RepID=A0A0D8BW87_GEOKU|nr:hypothetical protein [Geobacillus kaustophilus]KJE28461.1 hypothetical protein LG52_3250 [Geobacillus kaustophilus]
MRNQTVISAAAMGARLSPAEAKLENRRPDAGKVVMAIDSRQRLSIRGHRHGVDEAFASFPASFALPFWHACLRFGRKAVWSGL